MRPLAYLLLTMGVVVLVAIAVGIRLNGLQDMKQNYFSVIAAVTGILIVLISWWALSEVRKKPDVALQVHLGGDGGVLTDPETGDFQDASGATLQLSEELLWMEVALFNRGLVPTDVVYFNLRWADPRLELAGYSPPIERTRVPTWVRGHVVLPIYPKRRGSGGQIQLHFPGESATYKFTFDTVSLEGTKSGTFSIHWSPPLASQGMHAVWPLTH